MIELQSISRETPLIMEREHFHGRLHEMLDKNGFLPLRLKDNFVDKYFMRGNIKKRVNVRSCRIDIPTCSLQGLTTEDMKTVDSFKRKCDKTRLRHHPNNRDEDDENENGFEL